MEEEANISEEYKKWFNRGYHLRSTMPEVFKNMTVPQNEPKEITQAFEAGRKQFEKEHGIDLERDAFREKMKESMRSKGQQKNRGR
ncbi:hypothetical protein [uncultured Roseivirga sp.]|uniref:hypothetical protein n=1 Tax=uncultured Roseivirga sp. TaxID=543088 RepID=UPI0030DAC7A9|tara:strand:- start:10180 stop:10437 length:258 start_codon:yes stop_codon:yes gene_type:complete